MLECRKTMTSRDYEDLCGKMQSLFLQSSMYKKSRSIMFYLPVNNEPDTDLIMADAFKSKRIVLLPYIKDDRIYPVFYTKDMPLKRGRYKINEPENPEFFLDRCIDVVLVPGVAFDNCGNRIGYGKGYYDKFLSMLDKKTVKVGFSFNRCIVKSIGNNEWDIPVDFLFTETGLQTKEQKT